MALDVDGRIVVNIFQLQGKLNRVPGKTKHVIFVLRAIGRAGNVHYGTSLYMTDVYVHYYYYYLLPVPSASLASTITIS